MSSVRTFKCRCGGQINIEFDDDEISSGRGRVVPCTRCFHEVWKSWIQIGDDRRKKVQNSAEYVTLEDGTVVKKRIDGAVHMNKKIEHGKKLRLLPDGRMEVVVDAICDCTTNSQG